MPNFSPVSLERLSTCHPDLVKLCMAVIEHVDFSVICGFRNEADQEEAVAQGRSEIHWPHGKHNANPSLAVDLAPYPVDFDENRSRVFAGYVLATAASLGIRLRWGGDWNGNWDFKDQTFNDLPHFELVMDPEAPGKHC